ncbi:MAG: hypothetical protein PVH15_07110, partial [Syntrophobacterales bacterium]
MDGIEQAVLKLNEGLTSRALKIWKGDDTVPSQLSIYDGLEELFNPNRIRQIRSTGSGSRKKKRLFHSLLGHYLQYRVFPFE